MATVASDKEVAESVSPINGHSDTGIPAWFLDNCVRTTQEMAKSDIDLIVHDDISVDIDYAREQKGVNPGKYEVDLAVYEALLHVFESKAIAHDGINDAGFTQIKSFRYDAIHLGLPANHRGTGGAHFLSKVVERFAQDCKADLIILEPDDIIDLAEYCASLVPKWKPHESQEGVVRRSSVQKYDDDDTVMVVEDKAKQDAAGNVNNEGKENAIETPGDNDNVDSKRTLFESFSISALLSSPDMKRVSEANVISPTNKIPLVIHIRKAANKAYINDGTFFTSLREAIARCSREALVISTVEDKQELEYVENEDGTGCMCPNRYYCMCRFGSTYILQNSGTKPRLDAICMTPISNASQRALLKTHAKVEAAWEQENIRLLQRQSRRISSQLSTLPLTQPYASWNFLSDTPAQKQLKERRLDEAGADAFISSIGEDSAEEDIKKAILRSGRREAALDHWCDHLQDNDEELPKWSTFPPYARHVIEEIEANDDDYGWEQLFLNHLLSPSDVEESWSEIAIETEVKDTIVQLLQQPSSSDDVRSYGILKRGRVGGALLYGPPGTGKTHLARVVARESGHIMITASYAELQKKYVGETEKTIKALFTFARKLHPCIVFLDEADSILHARGSEDRDYVRGRVNQLLQEMDGLRKSKDSPFVILATNFPHDLDDAVLRRAPSRIHIGLPSPQLRRQIFKIWLRDEVLDSDVDYDLLVEKSLGYSGSDIQTVCVQAALICDVVVNGDERERRLLQRPHFEKAFTRCSPTVSKTALERIRKFAKEYDVGALKHMNKGDERGIQMSGRRSYASYEDAMAPFVMSST